MKRITDNNRVIDWLRPVMAMAFILVFLPVSAQEKSVKNEVNDAPAGVRSTGYSATATANFIHLIVK